MNAIGSCTVVLIAFVYSKQVLGDQIDQTPLVATCSAESTVQVFRSLLFIDLISAHDPKFVFGLSLPSVIAADRIYKENLRILQDYGLHNAAEIGTTVANAISLLDVFTLSQYFFNVVPVVGEFLADIGLLSCDNAIQRATEYFEFEQSRFQTLDPTQLESYVEAVVKSLGDLLDALGYNSKEKEENWQILADLFYKEHIKYI